MARSWKKFVGAAKYLKKEDIAPFVNTELLWIKEEQVQSPGKGAETKLVLYLDGLKKGLVLNTANAETLAEITGTDDYELWKDIRIQLYVDEDITFGQKKVGGIRIRQLDSGTDTESVPEPVPVPVPKLKLKRDPY